MTISKLAPLVEKEEIAGLYFPDKEVLLSSDLITKRSYQLQFASQLSTVDHIKMRIVFVDSEGVKQVETGVWAVTNQRVILKDGATIPIQRIHEIKI